MAGTADSRANKQREFMLSPFATIVVSGIMVSVRLFLTCPVTNHVLAAILVLTIKAVSLAQQATSSCPQVRPVLLQVVHLSGDQYSGFRESCLLVHEDGRYHRELRRQESIGSRPTGKWNPVQVFEGELSSVTFKTCMV